MAILTPQPPSATYVPLPVHIPLSPLSTPKSLPTLTTPTSPLLCPTSPRKRKDQRRTRRMTIVATTTAEVSAFSAFILPSDEAGSTDGQSHRPGGRRRRSLGRVAPSVDVGGSVEEMEDLVLPEAVLEVEERGRGGMFQSRAWRAFLDLGEEEQREVLSR